MIKKPGLYGIENSNRDFEKKESWGKNQFNSSFPISLALFLEYKGLENNYIILNKELKTEHSSIDTSKLFKADSISSKPFYAFESQYSPYQKFVIGTLPRVDLVVQDFDNGNCLRGIEIKLTALPDNSTCKLESNKYGSELVIRPDTIVYLACSIAEYFEKDIPSIRKHFDNSFEKIDDWSEAENVIPYINNIVRTLDSISLELLNNQTPLVMQPIWKTDGKSPMLSENCLDVFVWSNLGFMQLFVDAARDKNKISKINRQVRTVIWLYKMLLDFSQTGQFDNEKIIDELSYNTKNDKAFAVNGSVTQPYMKSNNLTNPRINKVDIQHIILGGGQSLLSPERRFDAIIYNSPELFIIK